MPLNRYRLPVLLCLWLPFTNMDKNRLQYPESSVISKKLEPQDWSRLFFKLIGQGQVLSAVNHTEHTILKQSWTHKTNAEFPLLLV